MRKQNVVKVVANCIMLALILLLLSACVTSQVEYEKGDTKVKVTYTSWKKISLRHTDPISGAITTLDSNPDPWANLIKDVFQAGFDAGKAVK